MTSTVVLVGGGGHCKAVIDVILAFGEWNIEGILEKPEFSGDEILGIPVIGDDDEIPILAQDIGGFLVTVGHLGRPDLRRELAKRVIDGGGKLVSVVSPSAHIATRSHIRPGSVVFHNAVINSEAEVGENCIVNTGAIVEHDSIIGNHVHISTNAVVNGGCRVGEGSFIGSGSVVNHELTIGENCIIGSGAVVTKNTMPGRTYVGVPAVAINER